MQPSHLRPMPIGDLLDTAFRFYRTHFLQLITLTALVLVPLTILRLLLLATPIATQLLDSLQNIFLLPLIGAALTTASTRVYWNETVAPAQAYRDGARRYLSILGATFLTGLIIGLPVAVIGGCLIIGLLASNTTSPIVWVLLVMVLLPFITFVGTKYAVTFPAIIIEGVGASTGMSRSWSLTTGKFWHAAGVLVATSILTILLSQLPTIGVAYVTGTTGSGTSVPWLSAVQVVLVQLGLVITLPFQYLVPIVLYYDLRIRNEGYDLELASQSGHIAEHASVA